MSQPKVAIRLGTEGKGNVQRDFADIGAAGDAAANRASRSFIKASEEIESAVRRQAAAADKLSAIMPQSPTQARINVAVGTGSSLDEGSARISAQHFRELIAEQERYAAGAAAVRAQVDPAWAAQQRFDAELAQARILLDAGALSAEHFAAKEAQLRQSLDQTTAALADQARQTAALNQAKVNTVLGVNAGPATENGATYSALAAQMEQQEQAALRLRAALDPAWAAQQRFNAEMAEARILVAAGAITLDEYCAKLRIEQSELDAVNSVHGRVTASSGAMRAGMQQAGFQFQDFFVQVAGGTDATRAFTMQAPQLIGSLQMMTYGAEKGEGRFAKFASVLGGPWGIALGVAIPLAGIFYEKLVAGNNALDDAVAKLKEDAKQSEISARARDIFTRSIEGQIEATRRANDELSKLMLTEKQRQQITVAKEQTLLRDNQADRPGLAFQVAKQQRVVNVYDEQMRIPPAEPEQLLLLQRAADKAREKLDALKTKLRDLDASIVKSQSNIQMAQQPLLQGDVEAALDKRAAATQRYTDALAILNRQLKIGEGKQQWVGSSDGFSRDMLLQGASSEQYKAGLRRITEARDAELKKIDEVNKALRSTPRHDGDAATTNQVSKILLEAFGGTITSTTGGKHVKGSYHYRGQAVDFVPAGGMGAISKDDVRRVLEGAGLTIKELLGPGDKGHSDHYHAAWAGGKGEIDSARINGQLIADEVRKALSMEKQRNDWANDQAFKADENGRAALAKEGDALADRDAFVSRQRDDVSAGTILLNTEWELRGKSRQEIEKAVELQRYQLDIQRQMPGLTAEQVKELVDAKKAQLDFVGTLDVTKQRMDELNQFGEHMVDTVLDPSKWSDWGDLGKQVINDLKAEFMKLILLNPLKNMLFNSGLPTLFGGGGGAGGILGAIGGMFGGGTGQSLGSAIGHDYTPAGAMWVGENGPELVDMPRGARVMTASDSRRMASGGGQPVIFAPNFSGAVMTEDLLAQMEAMARMSAAYAIDQGSTRGAQLAASEARYTGFRSLEGR